MEQRQNWKLICKIPSASLKSEQTNQAQRANSSRGLTSRCGRQNTEQRRAPSAGRSPRSSRFHAEFPLPEEAQVSMARCRGRGTIRDPSSRPAPARRPGQWARSIPVPREPPPGAGRQVEEQGRPRAGSRSLAAEHLPCGAQTPPWRCPAPAAAPRWDLLPRSLESVLRSGSAMPGAASAPRSAGAAPRPAGARSPRAPRRPRRQPRPRPPHGAAAARARPRLRRAHTWHSWAGWEGARAAHAPLPRPAPPARGRPGGTGLAEGRAVRAGPGSAEPPEPRRDLTVPGPWSWAGARAVPAGGNAEPPEPSRGPALPYPRPQALCGHRLPIGSPLPTAAPDVIISFGRHVRGVSWQRPKESQHIFKTYFPLLLPPAPSPVPQEVSTWAENSFLPLDSWAQAVRVAALGPRQVLRRSSRPGLRGRSWPRS